MTETPLARAIREERKAADRYAASERENLVSEITTRQYNMLAARAETNDAVRAVETLLDAMWVHIDGGYKVVTEQEWTAIHDAYRALRPAPTAQGESAGGE